MAAKGGGSWKVAYADFVTAMMAFFLVMWIGAQDTKTRQSVANYFVDPSGVSKKPVQSGAVLNVPIYGNTPKQQSTEMGRGRQSHSVPGQHSPPTKIVSDWIHADDKRLKYWQDRATAAREAAAQSPDVLQEGQSADEVAVRELAKQLRAEVTGGGAKLEAGLSQDLLFNTFWDIHWTELAQDLILR